MIYLGKINKQGLLLTSEGGQGREMFEKHRLLKRGDV